MDSTLTFFGAFSGTGARATIGHRCFNLCPRPHVVVLYSTKYVRYGVVSLVLQGRKGFLKPEGFAAQASSSAGSPLCKVAPFIAAPHQKWRIAWGSLPFCCCRSCVPASIPSPLPIDAFSCSSTTSPPSPRTLSTSNHLQVIPLDRANLLSWDPMRKCDLISARLRGQSSGSIFEPTRVQLIG